MSAILQSAADAYLAARQANIRAEEKVRTTRIALLAAEDSLIDSIVNGNTEGEAVVCGGEVLLLKDEYWDQPAGIRITVHRLVTDPSEVVAP